LQSLPTGGRTPLAHALQLSLQFIEDQNTENKPRPFLVLLSDGKANVPLAGGGDPWQQVLQLAARIAELNVKCLVLDTESGYLRLGRAAELSEALNAAYLPLDALSTEKITEIIHSKIHDVQQ
jgi:magnesium chelatase subunit D